MLEGIGNFETQQLKEWSCQLFILGHWYQSRLVEKGFNFGLVHFEFLIDIEVEILH